MERKKTFIVCILLIVALTSCSQDEQLSTSIQRIVFTGQIERLESRVILGDDFMMNWEIQDQISIFPGYNINSLHEIKSIDTSGRANFGQAIRFNEVQEENATKMSANYAVYPYYDENSLSSNEIITCKVPESFDYSGMGSSIKHALMVAKSTSNSLSFTNAQGILRLRLNARQPFLFGKVKYIQLVSNSDEKPLSGTATMDYSSDEKPCAKISPDGNKTLTIHLSENLQNKLPATQNDEYATYYIPIVADEYKANDITMVIHWAEENIKPYSKHIGIDFTIKRNTIYTLTHIIEGESFDGEFNDNVTEN